jgi:biopolymer transport protein ExbD
MMDFFTRRHRRPLFELQLTAMIDIFSMIVIFLIKGTVFGNTDASVPDSIKLPQSISKEMTEAAPQVTITKDSVWVSNHTTPLPLSLFLETEQPRAISDLKNEMKSYLAKLAPSVKARGVFLNIVADKDAPYRDVFRTLKVFRESGFETMLFVATGTGDESK